MKPQNLIFFWKNKDNKKAKITKRAHAFKNYAHAYDVEILNFFNPELELENKSGIKNKVKNSLNELRRFKFIITLVVKF